MNQVDNNKTDTKKIKDSKEYAELLKETKGNAEFYKLVSVAVASYTDGVKSALRCQQAAAL